MPQLPLIDKLHGSPIYRTYQSLECLVLMTDIVIQRHRDRSELELLDREKISGILNFDLPLILVITILDRNLTRFLVDDLNSCNVLFADMLELLGLQRTNLNLYFEGFNNSPLVNGKYDIDDEKVSAREKDKP